MDNSPSGLNLNARPRVRTLDKKPLYIILTLFLCALLYMIYAMSMQNQKTAQEGRDIDINERGFNFLADGSGLAGGRNSTQSGIITTSSGNYGGQYGASGQYGISGRDGASGRDGLSGRDGARGQAGKDGETLFIVRSESEMKAQEQSSQKKAQAHEVALLSPLFARTTGNTNTYANNNTNNMQSYPAQNQPAMNMPSFNLPSDSAYDPASQKDKEEFFSRSKQLDSSWISPDVRTRGQRFELKTGSVLPAVLITGINSDLPGNIIAQVSQNIYDSTSGKNLLIPQGSKLFGQYDSRVIFGQSRVLVAWNRIIFPDGSSITLPAMPGADMSGYAGFEDQVNNHYFRIFGTTALMSLITGGMTYAIDGANSNTSETSLQSTMTTQLATQIGQTATTLLEKNLSISPTLEIRIGYQFNIVLGYVSKLRDFVFFTRKNSILWNECIKKTYMNGIKKDFDAVKKQKN